MRFCAPILALIFPVLAPSYVHAIYADEAYKTDYHHALLGFPQSHTTFFHRPSAASKASLLYTLSEKLVLGAVNPKDGSIVWRQQLAAGNLTHRGYLRAEEGGGAIASAAGGEVQSWNAADGRLDWAWSGAGSVKGIELLSRKGYTDVVVLNEEEGSRGVVRKLASGSGDVVWEIRDESGDVPFGLSVSQQSIYQISLHSALLKGYKIKVTALDIAKGTQGIQHTLSSESEVTTAENILFAGSHPTQPLLIWTDSLYKVLKVNIIGTKHVTSINIDSSGRETTKKVTVHAPQTTNSPPHFLVHYESLSAHWAQVYHVDPSSGSVKKLYTLPELGVLAGFSASADGDKVYFTRHTDYEISLLSSTSEKAIHTWPVRPKSHGGLADPQGIAHAVSEVVPKGPSSFAVRSALTFPSGDWGLVRNGDPVWLRSESLVGTVAAQWIESIEAKSLAQELAAESDSGIVGAYVHRCRRHARDIVTYFPGWIESLPDRIMGVFTGSKGAELDQAVSQDSFGFKKMIIVATEQGRLAALDAGNQGKVIWNIKVVDIAAGQKWQVLDIKAEGLGIVEIHGLEGELLRVKALNGEIVQHQPGGISTSLRTWATVIDTRGQEVSISVNKDGSVAVPYGAKFARGTVVTTHGDDNIARGWTFGEEAERRLAWEFVPAPGEQILSLTSRPSQDPVASIGKALGDRNVMYKYLNANLLLITTIEKATSKATIYLLDSTTGEILYNTQHSGVDTARPIVATMAENWFAYSLTMNPIHSNALKGPHLIVSELFESSLPNDRGPLGSTSNYSTTSSSILPPPYVLSQAYILPSPISHLTTTSTLQSITPRSLLATIPALHGIISIPRSIIDPRRPIGRDPTGAEAEEGLFRHSPHLDFEPKWMLTHQRDVMGLTNVITAPSKLESTGLVFAYGALDVFGTRLAPIGAFDMLGKGFSRFQLVMTVVGLGVGTGALGPMVRKKQIDAIWKA